jgi:AsmA family
MSHVGSISVRHAALGTNRPPARFQLQEELRVASMNEHFTRLKTGARRAIEGARERARNFKWRSPSKTLLIWTGSIFAVLVAGWVTLNLLLANPSTGTPMINWALGTFGDKSAHVQTGHLEHPFSGKLVLRTLDWPGAAEAREIDVHYDVFGFLPGRIWAKLVRVRDGEIILEEPKENESPKPFNPQAFVNAIDAENVTISFSHSGKPRIVTIVKAQGSFLDGSVRAEAVSGKNRITFDGLQRDWGGSLKGHVTARGENMKDLAEIAGAAAPDTPPFDIQGALSVQGQTWSVENLSGTVGDSDLGGLVRINLAEKKPLLTVALKSDKLDFDDLGVVFGIPVGTGKGETVNAEQKLAKAEFDKSARLIPDAQIDFTRLGAVNADFEFEAKKVVDAPMGISAMSLTGQLRDSVLDFERAVVKSGAGDLDTKLTLDARKDPATTRATGTLSNMAISKFAPNNLIRGTLNGRFALTFTGSGFRDAAATSTGEAGVWSNNSELSKFATEGAGLDIGEILLLFATEDKKNPEFIPSRCLAANIAFKNGQATLQPAVIENEDSLVAATGGVNMKTEAVDIQLFAKPHDVSIGTISGDLKIGGTLRNPTFEALNEETLVQAAASALLASITGALAILPFIQTGGEPDAPCATLLADAKETNTRRNPAAKVTPKAG